MTTTCSTGCIPTGIHDHPTREGQARCVRCGWFHGSSDPNVLAMCASLGEHATLCVTCNAPIAKERPGDRWSLWVDTDGLAKVRGADGGVHTHAPPVKR